MEPGDFQGSETLLVDIVMVDTDHYMFVKIYRIYNQKMTLNVSYGL